MEIELVNIIYQQYAREIYFYLLSLTQNGYQAEDLLQEVFYKAICSLPDSHTNIRAWLYKVAKNTYINEAKKEQRNCPLEEAKETEEKNVFSNPTLQRMLQTETEQMLYRGMMTLPDRQRKILTLQYFSGFSVKEIAGLMGLSVENVRVLSHRGRK